MKKIALWAMCIAVMVLSGCRKAPEWKAEHVFVIGLDGWGAYSVAKADMPNVKALMDAGCYTLKKRSVLPSSSAVNWASMFMGAGPELHGYTEWGSRTPELPSRVLNEHGIFSPPCSASCARRLPMPRWAYCMNGMVSSIW